MKTIFSFALLLSGCSGEMVLDASRAELAAEVAAAVDEAAVWSDVEALVAAHREDAPLDCSVLSEPDEAACHLTDRRARRWITARLRALGYDPRVEVERSGGFELANIVAELPGESDEVVLIGAHYDAAYAAADDNSSGVAVLLELARILRGRSFPHTVRFVAFDLQRLGMAGSTRYVRDLGHQEKIALAVIIDSVAYTAAEQPGQLGVPFPSTGDFLAVIADEVSSDAAAATCVLSSTLKLGTSRGLLLPELGLSPSSELIALPAGDQAPFWSADIPTVLLTDTGSIRNEHAGTAADDLQHLDRAFLGANARIAAAAVAYVAGETP